jgi:hypothetical protein
MGPVSTVSLEPTHGLYVVSDVHGHLEDLRRGLGDAGLIDADGRWTWQHDHLWVLGDLLDRGPDGIGVVDLLMSLQEQAPEQVHVLLGNHEALAVGRYLFPQTRFDQLWVINGGRDRDQVAFTDAHLAWMRALPPMGRVGDYLLVHSDVTTYLEWGSSVDEVNATVHAMLADDDLRTHWEVFARLTGRYDFAGTDGSAAAERMLRTFGGECLVHGHSIIGSLVNRPSDETVGPLLYADGLVLAIDGGRYDGGPLLVVRLN